MRSREQMMAETLIGIDDRPDDTTRSYDAHRLRGNAVANDAFKSIYVNSTP